MIDVEKLKRDNKDPYEPIEEMLRNEGWNDCLDYLAARNLLGGVPQWQPIETAPKDGNPLLVFADGIVGEAINKQDLYPDSGYEDERAWWWANTDSEYYSPIRPTHWMLLPAAPNAAEVG